MFHDRLAPLLSSLVLLGSAPSFAVLTAFVTDKPVGWASQNGGTAGGAGGTEVTVTTMADLQKYAKMSGKYVIWVKGTIGSYGTRGNGDGDRVVVASDKSILGLPGAHVKGGFDINNVKNVVIRNLVVEGPGAVDNNGGTAGESRQDAISVVNEAKNIWLDHLSVLDGEDGNTDVTKASDFVTISWTKFSYTDKSYVSGVTDWSHRFCNLLGGSDTEKASSGATSVDKLNVTFYKTWWGEGVAERMPRVRFGKVHVANCLFNSTDKGQGHNVRAAYKANLLVESNVFIGQKKPIDLFDGDFTAITVKNNVFTNCSGNMAGSGTAFTPPYTLSLSSTATLQSEVTNADDGAGPTIDIWNGVAVGAPAFRPVGFTVAPEAGTLEIRNTEDHAGKVRLVDLSGQALSATLDLPAHGMVVLPAPATVAIVQVRTERGLDTRMVGSLR